MKTLNLSVIVEGHGEREAVPLLLRRIRQIVSPDLDLKVLPPLRIGRYKLIKQGEIERAVELAARRAQPPRAILILVDAEDEAPCVLGPTLLARAKAARPDTPIGVVLAKHEFEAWFLAAMESISSRRGLRPNLTAIAKPEAIRDAKGLLTSCMEGTRAYSPVVDQAALTAAFDMDVARKRSDSFDKCWREAVRLFSLGANP